MLHICIRLMTKRNWQCIGMALCWYISRTRFAVRLLPAMPLIAAIMLRFMPPEVNCILLEELAHLLQRTVQGDDIRPALSQDAHPQLRDVLANSGRAHTNDLHRVRVSCRDAWQPLMSHG